MSTWDAVNEATDKFWRFLLAALLTGACYLVALYAWHSSRPVEAWFDYAAVEPVAPAYIGGQIRFASTRALYIELDMTFLDVLFCRDGEDRFERVSSVFETSEAIGPHPMGKRPWSYGGLTPNVPTACYLRSTVTGEGPFNIEKRQVIEGAEFPLQAVPYE